MTAVFTYVPDRGFSSDITPSVLEIKFGDGYSQRVSEGVNSINQKWSLKFKNRSNAEADAILLFLSDRGGYESFDWTPPNSSTMVRVIAKSWKEAITSQFTKSISTTFIRVYEV